MGPGQNSQNKEAWKDVVLEEMGINNLDKLTTTIAIHKSTKEKLDKNRAPGQCYNGFLCQLIELWEKTGEGKPLIKTGGN
jgi:hypothetical protein